MRIARINLTKLIIFKQGAQAKDTQLDFILTIGGNFTYKSSNMNFSSENILVYLAVQRKTSCHRNVSITFYETII